MNKKLMLIATALLGLLTASGQPAPPVNLRAPQNAAWIIIHTYTDEAAARPNAARRLDRIKKLTVTKTGETYFEQTVWASGNKDEKWVYNGIQFKTMPNSNNLLLISAPDEEHPSNEYSDYSRTDFPELKWLATATSSGTEAWNKIPALRFNQDNRRAWFALDTNLPLASTDGIVTLTYTYPEPPESQLVPEQKYLDLLAKYRRGLEALQRQANPD